MNSNTVTFIPQALDRHNVHLHLCMYIVILALHIFTSWSLWRNIRTIERDMYEIQASKRHFSISRLSFLFILLRQLLVALDIIILFWCCVVCFLMYVYILCCMCPNVFFRWICQFLMLLLVTLLGDYNWVISHAFFFHTTFFLLHWFCIYGSLSH